MPKENIHAGYVDELKVDRDIHVDKQWRDKQKQLILWICKQFDRKVLEIKWCKSRQKGEHYYIRLDRPIASEKANQMQYLIGDDSRRVDFNRARINSGLKEWSKLFEEPYRRLRTLYKYSEKHYRNYKSGR